MKNDLPDVSVIVPIFKVEKYIERCVRSLFEQSLDNIEYIFVDDASPDDSVNILLKLIQEYPSRSQNVKIIRHSKNRGLAMARSTGFLKSTGRYIIHCDSDDWVEQEMYEVMYQTAIKENADIVVCDFIAEYLTKHVYKIQKCALDKVAFVEQLLCGEIHNGICNKLINRKLYSFLSFHWKTGCNMWEDVSIIPRLAFFATKIAYVHHHNYKQLCIQEKGQVWDLSLKTKKRNAVSHKVLLPTFLSRKVGQAGGEGGEAVPQALLEHGEGGRAGAVAGIDPLHPLLQKGVGHPAGVLRGAVHAAGGGGAEHVQAAHHGVHRLLKLVTHPLDDVHDAPVGAGVEDHQPPLPLQHQGLLVGEIVGDKLVLAHLPQQVGLLAGEGPAVDGLRDQPDPLHRLGEGVGEDKAVPEALPDVPVDPDEPGRALGGGEIGPARPGAGVHLGRLICRKEAAQAVGVVIVPVGEHRQLHLAQVDPQGGGVVRKFPRGARVQQQLVSPVLDVKGQPGLRAETGPLRGRIFHQNYKFHGDAPLFCHSHRIGLRFGRTHRFAPTRTPGIRRRGGTLGRPFAGRPVSGPCTTAAGIGRTHRCAPT